MTLGTDIKEVYEQIGSTIEIMVDGEWVEDACIDTDGDMGSPYFRKAFFPFDTAASIGSVVRISSVGSMFIVATRVPDVFEDGTIEYGSLLYLVNRIGKHSRLASYRSAEYELIEDYYEVNATVHMFEPTVSIRFDGGQLGSIDMQAGEMYAAEAYGIAVGDRLEFGDDKFEVEVVKSVHPGIVSLAVREDNR